MAQALLALAVLFAAALTGCDLGPAHNQQTTTGPAIHVLTPGTDTGPGLLHVASAATNVGAGLTYTVDQPIRVAFDRLLAPLSVIRQSVTLQDSGGNFLTDPLVAYDPVTLTVTLSNPGAPLAWLTVGQQYRVVMPVPSTDGGSTNGVVAIDGAPLAAPVTILFIANAAADPPASEPVMHYCPDIEPWMGGKCNSCHTSPYQMPPGDAGFVPLGPDGGTYLPYEGLILGTIQGIQSTAIGQLANESNTGPTSTAETLTAMSPFGINMPIIDPGSPGNSWLMYKVLLATPSTIDDGYTPACSAGLAAGTSSPISDDERGRLSNFILGNRMPYPHAPDGGPLPYRTPLTQQELERLSVWIAQGARFDGDDIAAEKGMKCGSCP